LPPNQLIIVASDGVSLSELPGSTLLLLNHDAVEVDPIEGANLDTIDVAELDLPDSRVMYLAHLLRCVVANGY
jgi:hypothetical protein